jgi:hypothetical protein
LLGGAKDSFVLPEKIAAALSESAHTMKIIAEGERFVQGFHGQGKRKNAKFNAK